MSEDEKKLQRALRIVELHDAQSDLACLRDRALGEAEALEGIAKRLKVNADLEPSSDDFVFEVEAKRRLSPQEIGRYQKIEALVSLVEEMKLARQKVFNLRHRSALLEQATTLYRD
jgi:hypothetical protein